MTSPSLFSTSRKPTDMFLGFCDGMIRWVTTDYATDDHDRLLITGYGTIAPDAPIPAKFIALTKKSVVHGLAPHGSMAHDVTSASLGARADHGSESVIHQNVLVATARETLYQTIRFHMKKIIPIVQDLESKGITVREIHHPSRGYTDLAHAQYMVVSVGESDSWIAWIAGGRVIYQADVACSRADLASVIATHVSVNHATAQQILAKYGVTQMHPEPRVIAQLHRKLQAFTDCITGWRKHHLQYQYVPEPFQNVPHHLFITGNGSEIRGIEQYFAVATGMTAEHVFRDHLQSFALPTGNLDDLIPFAPIVDLINPQ